MHDYNNQSRNKDTMIAILKQYGWSHDSPLICPLIPLILNHVNRFHQTLWLEPWIPHSSFKSIQQSAHYVQLVNN